jgi:septal ring factor EnvC (AmiA/AmiB activator)
MLQDLYTCIALCFLCIFFVNSNERELVKFDGCDANFSQIKQEVAKFESALKAKEDEISLLREHVAQLTQSISQFASRPGGEEIKKRGWWQFWR